MDDEVDVDDEEADEQPKNKQPRTTPWPCRLQALDLQNRFHFQTREVARKTLNIASLREMKVTVPSLSDQRSAIRKVVRAFAWIDRIALEDHWSIISIKPSSPKRSAASLCRRTRRMNP